MPRPASSARMPQPDGSMLVYEYTGDGLTPSRIMPLKRDDLGTVEFLGTKVIKAHPELKDMGRRFAGEGRPRSTRSPSAANIVRPSA